MSVASVVLAAAFLLQTRPTPVPARRAADVITAQDIARGISIIADDSMRGRDTPSAELEKVASWVAAQFRSIGLTPRGDNGTFLQRYPLVRTALDTAGTSAVLSEEAVPARTIKGPDLAILSLGVSIAPGDHRGPLVLRRAGALPEARGAWIVQAAEPGLDAFYDAARRAYAAGAVGVLLIASHPDADRRALAAGAPSRWRVDRTVTTGRRYPVMLELSDTSASQILGIGVAVLRGAAPLPPGATFTLHVAERVAARTTAPNVVAVLAGSDPRLAGEYVLLGAHMDHVGVASAENAACSAEGADSICNGADDDASGTVAVIAAARAFAALNPRPRRSVMFLTVSGEEKGLWGSDYFATHAPVALDSVVADLNIDMVGRNWTDTIAVIGKEQSSLGPTVDSVAAAHPELRMTPIRDPWPAENFYVRSDHYNFARRGVPILFFFNGVHADYHRVSDEPAKIDAEKEARVARLIFLTGLAVANADGRPRWNGGRYRPGGDEAN